jgi:hypothetical protein
MEIQSPETPPLSIPPDRGFGSTVGNGVGGTIDGPTVGGGGRVGVAVGKAVVGDGAVTVAVTSMAGSSGVGPGSPG